MIRKMLVALALTGGLVVAPTAASAAPAARVATQAACSPHVTLQTPYSKFNGSEVWANWNVCFVDPGVWEVKLERKELFGWTKLDSYKATLRGRTGYSASLSYFCDTDGTDTWRLNARYDNAIGTYYWLSKEATFYC
jgi:hypothetical protein